MVRSLPAVSLDPAALAALAPLVQAAAQGAAAAGASPKCTAAAVAAALRTGAGLAGSDGLGQHVDSLASDVLDEVALRLQAMCPAMVDLVAGLAPSGHKRALRNTGAHVAVGEGAEALAEALRQPKQAQRGPRKRRRGGAATGDPGSAGGCSLDGSSTEEGGDSAMSAGSGAGSVGSLLMDLKDILLDLRADVLSGKAAAPRGVPGALHQAGSSASFGDAVVFDLASENGAPEGYDVESYEEICGDRDAFALLADELVVELQEARAQAWEATRAAALSEAPASRTPSLGSPPVQHDDDEGGAKGVSEEKEDAEQELEVPPVVEDIAFSAVSASEDIAKQVLGSQPAADPSDGGGPSRRAVEHDPWCGLADADAASERSTSGVGRGEAAVEAFIATAVEKLGVPWHVLALDAGFLLDAVEEGFKAAELQPLMERARREAQKKAKVGKPAGRPRHWAS